MQAGTTLRLSAAVAMLMATAGAFECLRIPAAHGAKANRGLLVVDPPGGSAFEVQNAKKIDRREAICVSGRVEGIHGRKLPFRVCLAKMDRAQVAYVTGCAGRPIVLYAAIVPPAYRGRLSLRGRSAAWAESKTVPGEYRIFVKVAPPLSTVVALRSGSKRIPGGNFPAVKDSCSGVKGTPEIFQSVG